MIILGIDPGTASTGYAVVQLEATKVRPILLDYSVVSTPPDKEMHNRLDMLYKALSNVSKMHTPDIMVIERLFFNTNAKTAITVGQARGVSLLVAAKKKMHVVEYTALEAKLILAGHGRAKKEEVQAAVKKYMNLKEIVKPDDANDAVAMALCFIEKDYEKFSN